MKTKQIIGTLATVSSLMFTGSALAAAYQPVPCTFDNTVKVNGMTQAAGGTLGSIVGVNGANNLLSAPVESTSCFGVVGQVGGDAMFNMGAGNFVDPYNSGNFNIGALGTSPMNGGSSYFSSPYYLPGIVNDPNVHLNTSQYPNFASTSTVGDLTGDGRSDPGWVYLGKISGNATDYGSVDSVNGPLKSLSTVLQMGMTGMGGNSGGWSLSLSNNIVNELFPYFGDHQFDHLAVGVKAGSDYSIYDFDFTYLGTGMPLNVPFSFTGTWSTADIGNKNISDLVLFARDPTGATTPPPLEVPEPGSVALVGVALLSLLSIRRRRNV